MAKLKMINTVTLFIFLFSVSILAQGNNGIKTFLLNGEYKKVINVLENKLREQDSLSFNEYNSLGVAYQNLMNYSKALSMLYRANKLQPENIRNLLLIGSCHYSLGNSIPAKFTYNRVLNLDSGNITAMVNLGKVLIDLNEFNAASEIYKKMISSDSTNSYFFSQLGICELKKGNKELAVKYFKESLNINNSNIKTILRLAKLYYHNKEYEKAKGILQQGLSQNSKSKSLNKMIAEVFYKKKQYEDAIVKYLYIISIGDSSAQVFQKLGISYYYLSYSKSIGNSKVRNLKLREGISALLISNQKENNDPLTLLYLGLCNKELGEDKEAIKYFEEALNNVIPDYIGEIYSNLGVSYGKTKNYAEAIKAYKEALAYNPEKKSLYFYLANVYDNYYEDKSVAVLYYKKFLNEDTDVDEKLTEYSKNRIELLSREADFWNR